MKGKSKTERGGGSHAARRTGSDLEYKANAKAATKAPRRPRTQRAAPSLLQMGSLPTSPVGDDANEATHAQIDEDLSAVMGPDGPSLATLREALRGTSSL